MVKKYKMVNYIFSKLLKRPLKKKCIIISKIKQILYLSNVKKLLKHKYYKCLKKNRNNKYNKKYIKTLSKKYNVNFCLFQLNIHKQQECKNLYNFFVNIFVQNGNVSQVKRIVDKVFIKLIHEFKITKQLLLLKIFTAHMFYVEVKKIKSRRRINYVPFLISQKRSFYLLVAWLREAVETNNQVNTLEERLYRELYKLIMLKESKIFDSIENNNKLAIENRSKIHFRW